MPGLVNSFFPGGGGGGRMRGFIVNQHSLFTSNHFIIFIPITWYKEYIFLTAIILLSPMFEVFR